MRACLSSMPLLTKTGMLNLRNSPLGIRILQRNHLALENHGKLTTIGGKSTKNPHLNWKRWLPPANILKCVLFPGTKTVNLLSAWNAAKFLIRKNLMTWRLRKTPRKKQKKTANKGLH